ncbi:MAG: protein kinase domain-containing protein, partial [Planctomycetota bacterium]
MGFEPGDLIDGLRIDRELGRGAFGVVYLARDALIGRPVALKVVAGEHAAASEDAREQVLTEARLVGGLNNPHVVTLYRVHSAPDGGWMLQMELVDGGCLEDDLEGGKTIPLPRALEVFRGVALALKTAHRARVLHGDLKPANVLFGNDGLVKLADFGLARMLEASGEPMQLFGQPFGTPRFMAPEVISGQEAGMPADVWSAAVLFYLCVTGRYPFPAQTYAELMYGVTQGDPDPLSDVVPPPVEALVLRCLAKNPLDRPEASEVVQELDAIALEQLSTSGPVTAREVRTNCSVPSTAFVGREKEREKIRMLLADRAGRLVTLTGPGGMGKTRLSQELCVELADKLPGGCWFADLSDADDADAIGLAAGAALGIEPVAGKDPVALVGDALQLRPELLLVLDNFEQVTDHAAETVGEWMKSAPEARFLVTSRARLDLAGEVPFELAPLALPSADPAAHLDAESALEHAAIRLFVERARDSDPQFELDDSMALDVARICWDLDGMPLAIELAAARVRVLAPKDIAARLSKKFQLLKSTRRDLSARQKTLTAAIEWSYDLLEDWEKEAYLQACCFRDGFSLDAAEEVIDLDDFDDAPLTLDVAQNLRDKSLLTATDTGYDRRLGMYRAIREFGVRKWKKEADDERKRALAIRHAEYFVSFASEWSRRIPGPRDQEALDRIALELGNLAAAHERALDLGEPALAAGAVLASAETAGAVLASAETARLRRPSRRLVPRLESSLIALGDGHEALRTGLLTQLSAACQVSGDWERALAAADEAVGLARGTGDKKALAEALLQQGEMRRNRGNVDGALESFTECETLAGESGAR